MCIVSTHVFTNPQNLALVLYTPTHETPMYSLIQSTKKEDTIGRYIREDPHYMWLRVSCS
jgi:hypothetical protein